jgi:hypothetical protein
MLTIYSLFLFHTECLKISHAGECYVSGIFGTNTCQTVNHKCRERKKTGLEKCKSRSTQTLTTHVFQKCSLQFWIPFYIHTNLLLSNIISSGVITLIQRIRWPKEIKYQVRD